MQSGDVEFEILNREAFTLRQVNGESLQALSALRSLGIYVGRTPTGISVVPSHPFEEFKRFGNRPVVSLVLPVYRLDEINIRQLILISLRRYQNFCARPKLGQTIVVPGIDTLLFFQLPADQNPKNSKSIWRICRQSELTSNSINDMIPIDLDDFTHEYLTAHQRVLQTA